MSISMEVPVCKLSTLLLLAHNLKHICIYISPELCVVNYTVTMRTHMSATFSIGTKVGCYNSQTNKNTLLQYISCSNASVFIA